MQYGLDLADPAADRRYVFAENRRGGYMVRSRSHKLLLSRNAGQTLFFDLQDDPFELHDLSPEPAARAALQEHRDALADWMLFEAITPNYSDEDAPLIRQPNVLGPRGPHRREMLEYFEAQVAGYRWADQPLRP
jgi:arylsulfatase A-like enzyme